MKDVEDIIRDDLSSDFLSSLSQDLAWRYVEEFEKWQAQPNLTDELRNEIFLKQRGLCAVRAMSRSASRHGIPYEFRRLSCNGQEKLLVKCGRVILIQQPILSHWAAPDPADYKRQLADLHGFVRQLELDLGDQPGRIRDWSGCVLGVILHGPAGLKFNIQHKQLGNLLLGVPDADFSGWVMRLDLHEIALYGRSSAQPAATKIPDSRQPDNVVITPRRRATKKSA